MIHTVPRVASLPLFSGVFITASHIHERKAMVMTMMMTAVWKGGSWTAALPARMSIFIPFESAPSHRRLLLLLLLLPFWVRRQQEREFQTSLSLLSRKHTVRNKSLIIKWNKTGLKLHSSGALWSIRLLKKRPHSLAALSRSIFDSQCDHTWIKLEGLEINQDDKLKR